MDIYDGKSGSEIYLKLSNQAFIVALCKTGESVAILIDSTNRHEIKNFIQQATLQLKEVSSFKVIGPSLLINGASTILENASNKSVKKVERDGNYELIYFPVSGKLRVTKQAQKVSKLASTLKEVKVLIVDDSKTIRNLLKKVFQSAEGINVVATAEKPSEVEALINEHKPDVITLDIHMPEMTGVDLLKIIGPKYNIPTIMVTSISIEEGPLVLEALENGAFDYVQKPDISKLNDVAKELVNKVKAAAQTKNSYGQLNKLGTNPVKEFNKDSMVVIGSSTGGTNALKDILTKFPSEIPPVLIVQHIPPVFSKAFADRMNSLCPFLVKEAEDGEQIKDNTVYVAPGGRQMKPIQKGGLYYIEINDDAPVNRFKPSVDYMFSHVKEFIKRKHIVSVILTGMGKDGASEMLRLKEAGALTIAQNEESCVVFGMPREAIRIGAAHSVEHKDDIAAKISEFTWPEMLEKQKAL